MKKDAAINLTKIDKISTRSPDSIYDLDDGMKKKLDLQKNMTFKTAPLKFQPNKFKRIEIEMAKQIKIHKITVPVVHLSENRYLIGIQTCICEMKGEDIYIKTAAHKSMTKFEDYITRNHNKFVHKISKYMVWHK